MAVANMDASLSERGVRIAWAVVAAIAIGWQLGGYPLLDHLRKIVEGPIAFYALCEHHALPFHGVAHVAYVAGPEILGISKLTRLVRLYARRFTVQERLGEQVADTLAELVQARGVAVRLEAAHLCTQMRGVEEDGSRTVTTFWRGLYEQDADLRAEFLAEARSRA